MFGKAKPPLAQAAVSRPLLEVPVLAKLANVSLNRTLRNSLKSQVGKERFNIADFILVTQPMSGKGDK